MFINPNYCTMDHYVCKESSQNPTKPNPECRLFLCSINLGTNQKYQNVSIEVVNGEGKDFDQILDIRKLTTDETNHSKWK